ncbi:MAG TPA: hypothetical protein VFL76_05300 [Edaphocola sp.]|nr:hypothetical protein [Edaphocola sp.]
MGLRTAKPYPDGLNGYFLLVKAKHPDRFRLFANDHSDVVMKGQSKELTERLSD